MVQGRIKYLYYDQVILMGPNTFHQPSSPLHKITYFIMSSSRVLPTCYLTLEYLSVSYHRQSLWLVEAVQRHLGVV